MNQPHKYILILGAAGAMGAGIVRDLMSPLSGGGHEITAADVSLERVGAAIAEYDSERVSPLALDVSDPSALAEALKGHDLCLNAVPTFAGHQMTIFDACLAAGVAYADLGGMGICMTRQRMSAKVSGS